MAHPLDGARWKIERAREHLSVLDDGVRAFVDSEPYRLQPELDDERGHYIIRVQQRMEVPQRLGLIVGDIVHNLRSALDHVVFQLASPPIGTGPGDRTAWPVFVDSKQYGGQESVLLQGVIEGHRARIEALQPYHARNAVETGAAATVADLEPWRTHIFINAVARMDNLDKHRLILPTVTVAKFVQPKFSGVRYAKGQYPGDMIRMEDGAELFRITELELLGAPEDVKMESKPTFGIGFGDPDFTATEVWTNRTKAIMGPGDLRTAAGVIEGVVESFTDAF